MDSSLPDLAAGPAAAPAAPADPAAVAGWQAGDDEAIRCALAIPVQPAAMRAIASAMAELALQHPPAISTARRALAVIAALDQQLAGLGPEQQRPVLEVRRRGPLPGMAGAPVAVPPVAMPPIRKADVIEYATELLLEESRTRYGEALSIAAALGRQRTAQVQTLLLVLPSLASWSRDPQLNGSSGGYAAVLQRS